MQILDIPHVTPEHTIETFLISTKSNDANWKIDRETGHEKVKSFIGKDFSIIPELLFRPLEQGGGGHVFGPKEQVLSTYAKNSHGKIVSLRGPYKYISDKADRLTDDDYYYNAIVKLNDSRAASALLQHGNNTWVPFAVSPHIFINEEGGGNDEIGWKDWSGAALALVIKGAYGNEAVVSKLCNGPHQACKMELSQRSAVTSYPDDRRLTDLALILNKIGQDRDIQTADLISSLVSRTASSNSLTMENTNISTEPPVPPAPKPEGEGEEKQQQMKLIQDTEVIKAPQPNEINISAEELNQLRETQKQFKEMQNERRDEILNSIFDIEDAEVKKTLIKNYQKLDLARVKELKAFHDEISPLISAKTKKSIEMELQKRQEEDAKKAKINGNGRAGSITLRAEPKVEEERAASTKKIDEVLALKKFLGVSS